MILTGPCACFFFGIFPFSSLYILKSLAHFSLYSLESCKSFLCVAYILFDAQMWSNERHWWCSWLSRLFYTPKVVGSIPSWCTFYFKSFGSLHYVYIRSTPLFFSCCDCGSSCFRSAGTHSDNSVNKDLSSSDNEHYQ